MAVDLLNVRPCVLATAETHHLKAPVRETQIEEAALMWVRAYTWQVFNGTAQVLGLWFLLSNRLIVEIIRLRFLMFNSLLILVLVTHI